MTRLERLEVDSFRGILRDCLPFDGGSIVLGGGNGTGKTAFVDALEFLFTGSVRSLTGTMGLSLRHHGPHIGQDGQETRVVSTFDHPRGEAARRLGGGLEVPADLQAYMDRGGRTSFILRRSQLQEFIHSTPADRYRTLADLIGAEGLERSELALKRARDGLQGAIRDAEVRLAEIEAQLAAIPGESIDADLVTEANEALAELGFSEYRLSTLDELEQVRARIVRSVVRPQQDPRAAAGGRLADELARGIGQETLREAIEAFRALTREGGSAPREAHMLDLLQVLRHGREYLKQEEGNTCPLCQQEVDTRWLLGRLVKRVAELEEVSLLQERLHRAEAELDTALQDSAARLRALDALQAEARVTGGPGRSLSDGIAMLRESVRSEAMLQSLEIAQRVERDVERWVQWADSTAREATPIMAESEPGEQTREIDAALSILQTVATRRAQAERGRQERARVTAETSRLRSLIGERSGALELATVAYSCFNRVKTAEIQDIYNALRSDLARFYDFLHPEEGHGDLTISVDPSKRGSSNLRMDFYDRVEEDPRAFGSEGHLDSLGLCIFLAFAKRFNADWPILVLDDVVSSVDAAHKQRVADLLFQEFGDRQLFITTHDARWFNDLRKAQMESGRAGTTKNIVIEGWTLAEGPRLRAAS